MPIWRLVLLLLLVILLAAAALLLYNRWASGRTAPIYLVLRRFLFADQAIEEMVAIRKRTQEQGSPAGTKDSLPSLLDQLEDKALASMKAADRPGAVKALRQVLTTPQLDPRRALVAWKTIRDLGESIDSETASQILGVVVEINYGSTEEPRIVSLAGYTGEDPRIFTSSGSGFIGEGMKPEIVRAGASLVEAARPFLAGMPLDETHPLPGENRVRFYLLTPGGPHAQEASRTLLETKAGGLQPLYLAAQNLRTAFEQFANP
jgi:hypothetical protein